MCNDNQKISGNITIRAKDKLTGEPLSDVVVTFGCGDYAACPTGAVSYSPSLDEPVIIAKLPLCIGGHIRFSKDGYDDAIAFISTKQDVISQIVGMLSPVTEFNVSFRKVVLEMGSTVVQRTAYHT